MNFLDFTTLAFAAAFLGTLFRRKNGPANVIGAFRALLDRSREPFHTIANCDLCAIFWCSVFIYSVYLAIPGSIFLWRLFALAGLALWLAVTLELKVPHDN